FGMTASGSDVFASVPHIAHALVEHRFSPAACLLGVGVLAAIFLMKRVIPHWPGVLIAVLAATLAARVLPLYG
ncbi:sodium-independent anion transporter, partial [Escherichia coli]|nr:sodium-independent anion transporter [Escherichia coli]